MSRERILGAVRSALDGSGGKAARERMGAERIARPPRHARPAVTSARGDALKARFVACLGSLGVDVVEPTGAAAVPSAIADYLGARGLPARLRRGCDAVLADLPWGAAPELVVEQGPARDSDAVGLSHAMAGVAETGTLVLVSGPDNPVTLCFLPDTHVVVVDAAAIVGSYEEALNRVRGAREGGGLPRTVNLITGASRTGDIGGKIVMGAHGPRRLAVVIVGGETETI